MTEVIPHSWLGWTVWLVASFAAGWGLAALYDALCEQVPRLRIYLGEAVSYRLHLLLIVALSRLLKLEVAREIRKGSRRRGR